jgi:K+-sensing histidine kinase KdpD
MRWKPFPTPAGNPPAPVRYGVALLAWAVALAATLLLTPFLTQALFLFFWPAVLFSAWSGGFGPALVVSVLATLAVDYTLIEPIGGIVPASLADLAPLSLFVLLSAFVSRLTGSLRDSEARIAPARGNWSGPTRSCASPPPRRTTPTKPRATSWRR